MKASVHLVSLGCAKNLVDSEVMLGLLLKEGHPIETDPSGADVVIVNTCGFIEDARRESIDAILKAVRLPGHPGRRLVVAGCMAQRHAAELQKEIPEVSAFVGINEVPRITEIVQQIAPEPHARKKSSRNSVPPTAPAAANLVTRRPAYLYDFATPRYQLTPPHYAWLKIAEGCNHPCAFCSIPIMRGRHRSRAPGDVVAETRALVGRGVKEIILISQDSTWYGRDLGLDEGLSRLLVQLNDLPGEFWIRVLYTHPAHWSDRLIRTIADCPKVCRYVDMPLQHIHDDLLTRMRRGTPRARIEELIGQIRKGLPGAALRTTFIVGLPGETEARFEELLRFVKQARFERLGVFAYSPEEGTVASRMEQRVSQRLKTERRRRIMAAQRLISRKTMSSQVGRMLRVLVEEGGRRPFGRSEWDAPGIDGRVLLRGGGWRVGEFQEVRVTGATDYDLLAERP